MFLGVALSLSVASAAQAGPGAPTTPDKRVAISYQKLPMSFEPNRGQADPDVKFLARGSGYALLLTPTETVLGLGGSTAGPAKSAQPATGAARNGPDASSRGDVLRVQFMGGNRSAAIEGLDEQGGTSNYYVGNDPAKWRTNVPHYARVRYKSVYPGIDVVYYGNQTEIEHDFIIAPGADPSAIRLNIQGAKSMAFDKDGNLLLSTSRGEVRFSRPYIYQQAGTAKTTVEGRYVRRGSHEVGFRVAAYNHAQVLVVDPTLAYASYLGGSGGDQAYSIAADNAGFMYVTGATTSTNFPVTSNAYKATCGDDGQCDTHYGPASDAFVTKIDTTQSGAGSLVYSTYLGGGPFGIPVPQNVYVVASGRDTGTAIATDASGNIYVAGNTQSFDFPVVGGIQAEQCQGLFTSFNGVLTLPTVCYPDYAFVAKFSPSGALLYSTYLGGTVGVPDTSAPTGFDPSYAYPTGIAVDPAGLAYVVGSNGGVDFPTTAGSFQTSFNLGSSANGFLTKIDPTKTGSAAIVYSTLLLTNLPVGVALDASSDVVIAGAVNLSCGAGICVLVDPIVPPMAAYADPLCCGPSFVAKFDLTQPGTSALIAGTFFQGNITSMALGSDGSVYVSGMSSTNLPGTIYVNNQVLPTPGAFDICAAPTGLQAISTDCAQGDSSGGLVSYISVSKISADLSTLVYSARLGGYNVDADFSAQVSAIAVDSSGNAYVTGTALVSYVGSGGVDICPGQPTCPPLFGTPVAVAPFPGNVIGVDCLTLALANPYFNPTNPIFNPTCAGGAFVTMLSSDGSALVYSNVLEGDLDFAYNVASSGSAVAVDSAGNAYFSGYTDSSAFPTTVNALQPTYGGGGNRTGYMVKIASATVGNTPVGTNVGIIPVDTTTGTSPVTIVFSTVTQAGTTSLTTSTAGTPPPVGFLLGSPGVYYDISTTATYSGSISICISYAGISFTAPPQLFHFQGGAWVNVTTTVDPVGMRACGTTTSLSPFALFQPAVVATTTSIGAAGVTYGTPASVTVSVGSSSGPVMGSVTLGVDGGAPSTMALASGSASFNVGVLSVGSHSLSAGFAAQGQFAASSAAGTLVVGQATLTITASGASRPYGANNPVLTGTIAGLQNGDPITASFATAAAPGSPVGAYTVTPMVLDPQNRLGDYTVTLVNGTLTVVPEATSLSLAISPSSISVGQSTSITVTLTGPDMVIPIDPGVLAPVTISSPIVSDILSNNGTCTLVPGTAPGIATCTLTLTAVEPNGRTLSASFPGSGALVASASTAGLIVTAPLESKISCISAGFLNVRVPAGSYLWFNSIFKVREVPKQKITLSFFQSSVQFQFKDASHNVVKVNQPMPDAKIIIDPSVTTASTTFDLENNVWITTMPFDLDDRAFLTGTGWLVPAGGLPADVEPVTWCGTFASDTAGIEIGWRWAAAAYSSFSADNTTLGVKPIDTDRDNPGANRDRAGTPETFKSFVIPGARGRGGKNYTGSDSGSARIE
jgi:hypothetical protein